MQSQRPSLFSSALSDDSSVSSGSDNDNDGDHGASPRSGRFGSADRRKANSGMSGTAAMRQRLSEARAGASAALLQPLTPVHRPPSPDAASTEFDGEYQLHTSLRHEPRAARLAHSLHGMAVGAASASSSATAAATSDAAAAPASSSSSLFSSFRGAASHHASPYRSRLFHSLTNGGSSAAPSHAGSAAPSALSSPTRNGAAGTDPLRLYAPSQAQSLAGSPSRPSSNGSNGAAMAPAPDAFQLQQTVAQLRRQLAEQDSALAQERSRRLAAQSELNSSTSPGAARHAASNPTMESTFFNHTKSASLAHFARPAAELLQLIAIVPV